MIIDTSINTEAHGPRQALTAFSMLLGRYNDDALRQMVSGCNSRPQTRVHRLVT